MTKQATKRKPQPTKQVDSVDTYSCPTCCRACKSTERSRYTNVITRDIGGTTADGRHYTSVSWKRTQCLACGQKRIDRVFRLKPSE